MGYSTDFYGRFKFDKPVSEQLAEYINRFSATRRMPRDNEKIKEIYPNWKELCFFGQLGKNGEYFAPDTKDFGQAMDDSIIDYNGFRSSVHPGLWCQWVISEDREYLEWDGGEKFYNYIEWLEYLIENFFEPLGYTLNEEIEFQGEDSSDFGTIIVVNNKVQVDYGIHVDSLADIPDNDLLAELERRGYVIAL